MPMHTTTYLGSHEKNVGRTKLEVENDIERKKCVDVQRGLVSRVVGMASPINGARAKVALKPIQYITQEAIHRKDGRKTRQGRRDRQQVGTMPPLRNMGSNSFFVNGR